MGKGKRIRREHKEREKPLPPLSARERKAMRREINAQILDADRQYYLDMNAAVLWALHKAFGFGKVRLRRFFDSFSVIHDGLREYYAFNEESNTWLCRHLLREETGVDVEAWEQEKELEENDNH